MNKLQNILKLAGRFAEYAKTLYLISYFHFTDYDKYTEEPKNICNKSITPWKLKVTYPPAML